MKTKSIQIKLTLIEEESIAQAYVMAFDENGNETKCIRFVTRTDKAFPEFGFVDAIQKASTGIHSMLYQAYVSNRILPLAEELDEFAFDQPLREGIREALDSLKQEFKA